MESGSGRRLEPSPTCYEVDLLPQSHLMADDTPAANDITKLLQAWAGGDKGALDDLIPQVYAELAPTGATRQSLRREGTNKKLQTTEVVNEAYVQLVRQRHVRWQNRAHFFGIASPTDRR